MVLSTTIQEDITHI